MMEEAEQQRRQLQDESDQRKQALQEALATQGKQGKLSRVNILSSYTRENYICENLL